ncbi:MAG: hypothetical protein H6732_11105 [Alphaproteobacteria bacterium]|nr:hypothetical protein [Alphaproteobacteria bacterium]
MRPSVVPVVLLSACAGGDFPTSYAGTTEVSWFFTFGTSVVASPDPVDETVTITQEGSDWRVAFTGCEVVATGTGPDAGLGRALVLVDLERVACDLFAEGNVVDVTWETGTFTWKPEELSVVLGGQGMRDGSSSAVTFSFEGEPAF